MIAVAASGAMAVALPVSAAFAAEGAAANATAAGSPGVLSGNSVQVPVHAPVNVCGNTVDVVGLLNPAVGNTCVNGGSATADGAGKSGSARAEGARKGTAAHTDGGRERDGSAGSGGASAHGSTVGSPGLLSGNDLQVPVHLPVNVSGNSVNVVGVGNAVYGNESVNDSGDHPRQPSRSAVPKPRAPKPPASVRSHPAPHIPRHAAPSLAHTGADFTAPALAGSAALIVAGAILYRRYTPGHIR
ncbi:chaplin [Streptomyces dangxiongensis]|uniref:Chaplin n=1 Tax=Streptomyces dangxiongensis TaxID=1442032 RepID=A0A3G2JIP6_9ACTN|nr:chaplin [Streptomyces dangxiongensis]